MKVIRLSPNMRVRARRSCLFNDLIITWTLFRHVCSIYIHLYSLKKKPASKKTNIKKQQSDYTANSVVYVIAEMTRLRMLAGRNFNSAN